jgi:hypothetical protein
MATSSPTRPGHMEAMHALMRPASEKRQGKKPREMEQVLGGGARSAMGIWLRAVHSFCRQRGGWAVGTALQLRGEARFRDLRIGVSLKIGAGFCSENTTWKYGTGNSSVSRAASHSLAAVPWHLGQCRLRRYRRSAYMSAIKGGGPRRQKLRDRETAWLPRYASGARQPEGLLGGDISGFRTLYVAQEREARIVFKLSYSV